MAYLSALAVSAPLAGRVFPPDKRSAFERLSQRLVEYGIPYDYKRPDAVTRHLGSMLAGRPRLALSAEALLVAGSILPDVKARVQERLPDLFVALREGLSHPRYSSRITG